MGSHTLGAGNFHRHLGDHFLSLLCPSAEEGTGRTTAGDDTREGSSSHTRLQRLAQVRAQGKRRRLQVIV